MLPISQNLSAQTARGDVEFIQLFNAIQKDLPRERVYLHTDRDWYFSGDRIWFSSYVTAGSVNALSQISTVLYVELYDPEMNQIERIALENKSGRGRGSILIDSESEPGVYKLKVYTAWSLNFGESYTWMKEIEIHNQASDAPEMVSSDEFDVDFLPEGGNLVQGIESRVGFKAIGGDGLGIDVSGVVYDPNDKPITDFTTEHSGMGDFKFTPDTTDGYYAVVDGNRFALPGAMAEGVVFSVSENEYEQFNLRLTASGNSPQSSYLVFGHVRGEVYLASEIEITSGSGFTVAPKSMFPTGPIHFTVLSSNGEPLSERLVFNENRIDSVNIELDSIRDTYGFREQVEVTINADSPEEEELINAFASVSVFDDEIDTFNPYRGDIRTKLLLESDIAGHIENPGYYFSDAEDRHAHADLLMLTQGWRAFEMDEVKNIEEINLFSMPEEGIKVSGQIKSPFLGRGMEDATVVFSMGAEHDDVQIVSTDDEGYFTIPDLNVTGSEPITIRANNEDGGDNVRIRLEEPFSHLPTDTLQINQGKYKPLGVFMESEKDIGLKTNESISDRAQSAQLRTEIYADVQMRGELEEIEVSGERETEDQFERDFRVRSSGSQRVDLDESPALSSLPVEILLNQIPGVTANRNNISVRTGAASFSGTPSPLIIVNGIESSYSFLINYSTSDIKTINVFRRGTELSLYGSRGSGGVINVRTRSGTQGRQSTRGFETAFVEGYQPPTRFYSPRYGFNVPNDLEEKDNRITLNWEPNLKLENGSANISFWTNDIPSNYRIEIEGITEFGIPFTHTQTFSVSKE